MSFTPLLAFLIILFLFFLLMDALAYLLLAWNKEESGCPPSVLPKVAILVAARNEASRLERCFAALEKLDYPADKLRIWIGNDGSTDETLFMARKRVEAKENWEVLDIREQWGRARGKANVLAQLAHAARPHADYYFITDADMAVPPSWINFMLRFFSGNVALVSGTSVVEANKPFARWQAFDWFYALGLAKAFTYFPRIGQPLVATGNNMAVERKAYEAVGGYEVIPFSVTEDYELYLQLKKKGYKSRHISSEKAKAKTLPVKEWGELLHQRKRWMRGALHLPAAMLAILCLQALFFPLILIILFWNPFLGFALMLLKLGFQALLIRKMMLRLGESPSFPFLGYELYSAALNTSLLLFYLMPIPVRWKGRRY